MNTLILQFRLWRLQRQNDRLETMYAATIRKARKQPNHPYEEEELYGELSLERDLIDDEIATLLTRHLCSTANRLMLPIPKRDEDGMWLQSPLNPNRWLLSPKGVTELRSAIRKERRESREQMLIWVSVTTGLIGTLTGLVSVLSG